MPSFPGSFLKPSAHFRLVLVSATACNASHDRLVPEIPDERINTHHDRQAWAVLKYFDREFHLIRADPF
jgi:hypothetical protein